MALSTTQYGYIIDPMVPFTDEKGKTIKNGFVRVFVAGSSTPVITYRNFDGATNQVLIELDNSGRTKTSVIGSKGLTYKVCVYDQLHSQESPILTVDKVSVIGANITAGAGATVVTGLDGLTTKPKGFVDASVVGTDGYVALDHTLVTDDLDTDAKVTAVENDRYIPLLNKDVNDPDSKMTLGRLWQWVLGHIKSLSTTITAFRTGDVIPVDGPSGTAKMSKDDLLKQTAQNALDGNIAENFDPTRTNDNRYIPGDVVCYQGKMYSFKALHYGPWSSADAVLIKGYDFDVSIYPKERFPGHPGGLNDCDLAEPGKTYFVTKNSQSTLAHMPYDAEGIAYLSCYKSYHGFVGTNEYYIRQIYTRLSPSYKIWLRSKVGTGSFSEWRELSLEQITIEIGQGKQFESLRSGIEYALSLPASKNGPRVILYPGTYDLVSDFMTELNDIDNKTNQFGMRIDRSIHLVAMAGAKIVANVDEVVFPTYTDSQFNKIKEFFNLFIVDATTPSSNIIFENLNIEAKNTRYCVHDELGSSTIPQIHKYINCTMKHTSDTREGLSRFPQCIGGGLGQNIDIIIDGGSYETIVSSGIPSIQRGDLDFGQEPITWHNSYGGGVKSSISINNVLLKGKGYFRFGYFGNTQNKATVLISGCKMYYPPLVRRENVSALYENFDVQDYSCETVVKGTWNSTSSGAVSSVFVPNE